MALTPLRKKLNLACGLVFLGIVGIALWPIVSRPFELRTFCGGLRPGVTLVIIRSLVANHDFQISPEVNGGASVYDIQSLGKFSCALSLQGGVMTSATFIVGN